MHPKALLGVLLAVALGSLAVMSHAQTPTATSKPASAPASQPATAWLTSYAEAVTQAEASHKLILANFTGNDWCSWCKLMHAEILGTKQFQDWAAKNVILLELDFPHRHAQDPKIQEQNKRLSVRYSIKLYPTVLFLTTNGEVVGESGYEEGGVAPWLIAAQKILDSAK